MPNAFHQPQKILQYNTNALIPNDASNRPPKKKYTNTMTITKILYLL